VRYAKVAVLACAGALALAITGCSSSGGGSGSSGGGTSATGPVTLDFPSWQENEPGYTQFYQSMVTQFEQAHKNVKIHFYEVTYDDYVQTITTRMAAGDPPDILVLPLTSYAQFAAGGDLTQLDSYLAKTDILSSWSPLQKSLQVNGHYYNVLMQGAGFALFVNKSILAAQHLSIPTTVSSLLSECKQLTGGGNYGIAMPTAQDPSAFDDASLFMVGEGQSVLNGTSYDLTSPGIETALTQYRQLAGCAAPGLVSDQMRQLYFSGKAAMMFDGNFGLPAIETEGTASVKKNTVMVSFPVPKQVSYVSSTLSIPASIPAADKTLAWEFIEQCTTSASQALFVKDIQSPAPRVSVDSSGNIPFAPVQTAAVDGANMIPSNPTFVENYTEIDTDFGAALTKLIASNDAIGPVLTQLQPQLPPVG
jgi:ABC-type glycerol-3-phosphate transport system substrate-binding protein